MDLDDFLNLSAVVVDEVEQAVQAGGVHGSLLVITPLGYGMSEGLTSSCVVQQNGLTWQMPVLDLVKLNVFLAAGNNGGSQAVVELGAVRFKVAELPGNYLCSLMLNKLAKLVDQNEIPHLVVLSSKTKELIVAGHTDRVYLLHWGFEGHHALAISIGGVQAIK